MVDGRKMLVVEYAKDGPALSDSACWKRLEEIQSWLEAGSEVYVETGNELLVNLTRLLVFRNVVKSSEIVYRFEGGTIPIGSDARIHIWPEGFCDNMERVLEELLGVKS